MTSHLLGLAVANLCFLAAGAGVGRALGLWRAPRDLPGALAPVYLVGVAVSGIAATWALVAGLDLARWQVVAGCALLAAVGFLPVQAGGPRCFLRRLRARRPAWSSCSRRRWG